MSFERVSKVDGSGVQRQVGVVRKPDEDRVPYGVPAILFQAMLARTERIEFDYRMHETGVVMTAEQLATMNKALGLTKDGSYRPYCLKDGCDYPRMYLTEFGFKCPTCHNKIGFDLTRYNG